MAAYAGLLANGIPPGQVVFAGDSAGGGLVVATALRLRERGLPLPAGLVLFSPWADLRPRGRGPEPSGETMLSRAMLDESATRYLAGRSADEPFASPVVADLHGLPPVLIQVAGVDSTLQVFPRRWHVFQMNAGVLADADRALDAVAAFVERRAAG